MARPTRPTGALRRQVEIPSLIKNSKLRARAQQSTESDGRKLEENSEERAETGKQQRVILRDLQQWNASRGSGLTFVFSKNLRFTDPPGQWQHLHRALETEKNCPILSDARRR